MLIRKFGGNLVILGALLLSVSGPLAADVLATVQGISVGSTVTLGGIVVPYKEVTFSAQVPGRIESLAGEEGDSFLKDELLIAITDDDLLARRRAAIAKFMYADTALRNAEIQYSREWFNPYSGQGNGSTGSMRPFIRGYTHPMYGVYGSYYPWVDRHARLYQQHTYVEQARAQLITARALIEEIDASIRDARSIAPFDGMITNRFVETGETVQSGQPLLEFSDMTKMQIQVEVPARLMPGVRKGMVFKVRLDVGAVQTEARVVRIFPVADMGRNTVTVKLDLRSTVPGGAGTACEVDILDVNAELVEIPVVPVDALIRRGSLPGIYVMNAENQREMRLVRTGEVVGTDRIAILSGLKIGERIYVKRIDDVDSN